MKNTNWFVVLIAALMVVTTFYGCTTNSPDIKIIESGKEHTIDVSGNSEIKIDPDLAKIYITIETKNKDVKKAEEENSELMEKVMAALKKYSVDIETVSYNVYPYQDKNWNTGAIIDQGYRVTNAIVVSTDNLEEVGKIIDVSINRGANRIDRVEFTLKDGTKKKAQAQTLKLAAQNAKEKAQSLAKELDIKVVKAIHISESNYHVTPYYVQEDMMESAPKAGATNYIPQISPKDVKLTARVTVSFLIE